MSDKNMGRKALAKYYGELSDEAASIADELFDESGYHLDVPTAVAYGIACGLSEANLLARHRHLIFRTPKDHASDLVKDAVSLLLLLDKHDTESKEVPDGE